MTKFADNLPAEHVEHMHALEVFERVLKRDPTREITRTNPFQAFQVKLSTGTTFVVTCSGRSKTVTIMCRTVETGDITDTRLGQRFNDKPFYELRYSKVRNPKLRKAALTLSKKISLFDLYQIMES